MTNEPVLNAGIGLGAITAVITLTTAFNVWNPTPEQIAAIAGAYTALIGIVTAVVRRKVTPVT